MAGKTLAQFDPDPTRVSRYRELRELQTELWPLAAAWNRRLADFTQVYKDAFFEGGASFYTQTVDDALAEIARLPGRHLYFLDDHLFGNRRFAAALFDGMKGMGRLWQAAARHYRRR